MAWQGVGIPIQKQEQASVLTPLVLFFLDCLDLPLWPHCLWPCRCITVPLPCSLPFFVSLVFTLYLSSLRLHDFSLCARPPRPMPSSQCSILAGHHGICRKSQIHGEADSRASPSPQIEPCPGLAMPCQCHAKPGNSIDSPAGFCHVPSTHGHGGMR
ncbi:hypothetical protein V8C40DRAFT_149636 [Trichoderma camerunense]